MAYTLKSFLAAHPEITDDQALAFCKNTGDSLDGLAVHLARARAAGVTLKAYFGGSSALKDAPPPARRPWQSWGEQTWPELYKKGANE